MTIDQLYDQMQAWRQLDRHDIQTLREEVAHLKAVLAEVQAQTQRHPGEVPTVRGYRS